MKQLLIISAIAISCIFSTVDAAEKSTLQASNAMKFDHAVNLLDGYRGDTSTLVAARAELVDVLKADPRCAPAYREMARYAIMMGHISSLRFQPGSLEAADSFIKKAIEINPNYAEAFVLRGHLYRLMDRHQDALDALEKAERLGTTDPWLQNNWADLLIDEGKYEAAAMRYRKVINSKTPNKKAVGSALEGLIRYYEGIGNLDRAEEVYKKQIEFEPNAAWAYGNYAQFLLCQKDDYENSIIRSRQALRIMDYGVGRYWLASALYRKWAQSVITGIPGRGAEHLSEAQMFYSDLSEIAANTDMCPSLRMIAKAIAFSKNNTSQKQQGATARARF